MKSLPEVKTDRKAWVICALLAGLVLVGVGMLGVRLRPYWVAKYRGYKADLRAAVLVFAPLRGADLLGADLAAANLRGADLSAAVLVCASLARVDLRAADLRQTQLWGADLREACLHGADLRAANLGQDLICEEGLVRRADLTGARYDAQTRWPTGLDPKRYGAVRVR